MMLILKSFRYSAPFKGHRVYCQTTGKSTLDYCTDLVRQHDYENFLATLLLSKNVRSQALVVRAFNVEVARVQDQTTDKKIAEIRLQFWKDAIDSIFSKGQNVKNVPAHPVAKEMFKVAQEYKPSKRYFYRLIEGRQRYLKINYFQSLEELEKYAEDTVSSIYFLVLAFAKIQNINADHVASHVGKAQGIVNLLRSVQVASKHNVVSIPMDVLMQHKVSQESILRSMDSKELRDVIFALASRANSHLEKARNIQNVPRAAYEIFIPSVAVNHYLTNLQKLEFNIFDVSLHRRTGSLPFLMYWHKFMKKY